MAKKKTKKFKMHPITGFIFLILVTIALCFGAVAAILMKTSLIKYGLSALLILFIMLILSIHAKSTSENIAEQEVKKD